MHKNQKSRLGLNGRGTGEPRTMSAVDTSMIQLVFKGDAQVTRIVNGRDY